MASLKERQDPQQGTPSEKQNLCMTPRP